MHQVDKESDDIFHVLVGSLVDVICVKISADVHGKTLTAAEWNAHDYCSNLYLWDDEFAADPSGRTTTTNELASLDEQYLLNEHVPYLCMVGPSFEELLHDGTPTPNSHIFLRKSMMRIMIMRLNLSMIVKRLILSLPRLMMRILMSRQRDLMSSASEVDEYEESDVVDRSDAEDEGVEDDTGLNYSSDGEGDTNGFDEE
ncbi:hypothetical protein HAX54_005135 [Datura stramonium]|uniref:Uncharacterized protein n=1 Tax=Datura stramonium TaxID=4076 RepID=A0ABS8T873_DATST|nr:hypothetical protein [Datura stramonium]